MRIHSTRYVFVVIMTTTTTTTAMTVMTTVHVQYLIFRSTEIHRVFVFIITFTSAKMNRTADIRHGYYVMFWRHT